MKQMKLYEAITAIAGAILLGVVSLPEEAGADQSQSQGQGQAQSSSSTSGASASGAVNGTIYGGGLTSSTNSTNVTFNSPADTTTTFKGGYDLRNVPNVAAPALTTTLTDTCMGSISAGAAIAGGGVTFGATHIDPDCVARLHARQLTALGMNATAYEVLCSRPAVLEADARMPAAERRCQANLNPPKTAQVDIKSKPLMGTRSAITKEQVANTPK